MKNLTILFSSFKRALSECPEIKVVEIKSQFDPPSEHRKRDGISELLDEGYTIENWIGQHITVSKNNSINYLLLNVEGNSGGAFNLNNPAEYLLDAEPWLEKLGKNEADQKLLRNARTIDLPNIGDTFTAVICPPGSAPKLPQSLIYFRRGKVVHLDLPLSQYLETMSDFMGFFHWQLLYSEAKVSEFESEFAQLSRGYTEFVRLFPGRDFSVWKEKLAQKGLK